MASVQARSSGSSSSAGGNSSVNMLNNQASLTEPLSGKDNSAFTTPRNSATNGAAAEEKKEGGNVKVTDMEATFMLFSSAMGGGVLGLPKVLAFNGWAYGCIMIVLGGIVSAYAQLICMRTLIFCNKEIEQSNRAIAEGEDSNVGDIHESPENSNSKRSAREQIVDLERAGQKAKKQAPIGSYSDLLAYVMAKKGYSKKSVEIFMHVVIFLYVYLGVCITYSGLFFKFMSPVIKSGLHGNNMQSLAGMLIEVKSSHYEQIKKDMIKDP